MLIYIRRRRTALQSSKAMPAISLPLVFSAPIAILFITLMSMKLYDDTIMRATIISEEANVRSSPSADQASLFTLSEGVEVILLTEAEKWAQVHYPGGLSGWVQKSNLYQTSGKQLW